MLFLKERLVGRRLSAEDSKFYPGDPKLDPFNILKTKDLNKQMFLGSKLVLL